MKSALLKLRSFYLAIGLSGGFFVPYVSLLLTHDELTSNQIGLIMSLGLLVSLLTQPLWGIVVDRYHIIRLTLVLSTVVPASLAMLYNSHWLWLLTLVSVFSSLFSAPQVSIANTYAVDIVRAANTSYGTVRCFQSLGFSLGSFIGGLYLSKFSVTTIWIPFSIIGFISTSIVLFMPKPSTEVAFNGSIQSGVRELLYNSKFMVFLIGSFLLNQTLTAFNTYFVLTYQAIGGSLATAGLAFLIGSGTNVPAMLIAAYVIKKVGREKTMLLAAFAYCLRWLVQAAIPIPAVVVGIQILHGLSFGFWYVAAIDYVSTMTRKDIQATGQSIFGMVTGGLAGIAGNLVNGYLLRYGGPALMYGVCTASSIVGVICFWYVAKATRNKMNNSIHLNV